MRSLCYAMTILWLGFAAQMATVGSANAGLVHEQAEVDSNLTVEVLSGYPRVLGYPGDHTTVGFVFHNRGSQRRLRLQLEGEAQLSYNVTVPAADSRRLFLYLPTPHEMPGSMQVRIHDPKNKKLKAVLPIRTTSLASTYSSPRMSFARLGSLESAVNVSQPWTDLGNIEPVLPDNWRGLSGVTAMAVQYQRLRTEQNLIPLLSDWVAMGGILLVVTPASVDPEHGRIFPSLPFAKKVRPTRVMSGLGAIIYIHPRALYNVDLAFLSRYDLELTSLSNHVDRRRDLRQTVTSLLRDVIDPPYLGLFFLLLLFAVLVGPLGWFVLVKRQGRPFVFLITVVGASTLFCLSLMGADLFSKGYRPLGSDRSLTLLDQTHKKQIQLYEAAVFTPTASSTKLTAPAGAGLFTLTLSDHDRLFSSVQMRLGSDDIQLAGALPVRKRALVGQRSLTTAQGRLLIEPGQQENQLRIENHLHGDLSCLLLWHNKKSYFVQNLKRGATLTTTPMAVADATGHRQNLNAKAGECGLEMAANRDTLTNAELVVLYNSLKNGTLGNSYYLANISADLSQQLFPQGMRDISEKNRTSGEQARHIIAGLF